MEVLFTKHAVEQMLERGVSKEDMKDILLKGAKFGHDKEGNMHARMLGIEVVYRKQEQTYRVITVFRSR